MRGNVLVIDDEREQYESLVAGLPAHNLYYAGTLTGVRDVIKREDIDLAIVDLNLKLNNEDRFSGIGFVKTLRSRYPELSILVLSKYRDIERIQSAVKNGATEYVWKGGVDIDSPDFREKINRLVREKRERDERNTQIQREIWGESPNTQQLRQTLHDAAVHKSSIFLYGETGTGKENAVHYLHYQAVRRGHYAASRAPVIVNLGHFGAEELRDILRGRTKGSFLHEAHNNLLFIKHLCHASLDAQEGLLYILNKQCFLNSRDRLSVQFILGLSEDPAQCMEEGRLHPDLYAALTCVRIAPLRDRPADIHHIVTQWLHWQQYDAAMLSSKAWERFIQYDYPGNVSELFALLDEMLEAHQARHPQAWRNTPIDWESVPAVIREHQDALGDMAYQVARLELAYIERALQRYHGQSRYKSRAALAVGVSSADNLKKTYIDKYARLFPELIRTFPMIAKCYKLDA